MSPILVTTSSYCEARRARDRFCAERGGPELWDRDTLLAYLPFEIAYLQAQREMVAGWQIEVCLETEGGDPPQAIAFLDGWEHKLAQVLAEAEAMIARGQECDVLALFATCRASHEASALERLAAAPRPLAL